jgi:hypothetical protein
LLDFLHQHHISIDGKVLKATAKRGKKKSGICIVSAWACEHNLVLAGLKTAEKSNEKKAIALLLEQLNLSQAVVSIDADLPISVHLGPANSPTIAEQIIDKGGEYIFSVSLPD